VAVDDNVDNLKKEALGPLTVCSDQEIEIMLIDFGAIVIIEKENCLVILWINRKHVVFLGFLPIMALGILLASHMLIMIK
jgi:hypothetical protein